MSPHLPHLVFLPFFRTAPGNKFLAHQDLVEKGHGFQTGEVPNLLTDYDPDFCVNFLDEIASKIGVCPAVFTATLIMARVPVVNSTFSQSTKPAKLNFHNLRSRKFIPAKVSTRETFYHR